MLLSVVSNKPDALYPHRPLDRGNDRDLRKVASYAAKHEARFMKLLAEQTGDGIKHLAGINLSPGMRP